MWWCFFGRLEHREEECYLPFLAPSSCPPPSYSSSLSIYLFQPFFQPLSLFKCHSTRTSLFSFFYHLHVTFPFNLPHPPLSNPTSPPFFQHFYRKHLTQPQTTAVSTVSMLLLQAGTCTLDSAACQGMRWE